MTIDQIKSLVIQKANQYGINPNIALAQIQRESSFNPAAVGPFGERGLAQFTQATWQDYGNGSFDNAFDPVANLDAWGRYMASLFTTFGGDYLYMLTGYNGGPGHLLNPKKYGPASQAAQNYAQAILAAAGVSSDSGVDIGPIIVTPQPKDQFPWLLVGGIAALFLFVAVSD